jgi:hypothetical protein
MAGNTSDHHQAPYGLGGEKGAAPPPVDKSLPAGSSFTSSFSSSLTSSSFGDLFLVVAAEDHQAAIPWDAEGLTVQLNIEPHRDLLITACVRRASGARSGGAAEYRLNLWFN